MTEPSLMVEPALTATGVSAVVAASAAWIVKTLLGRELSRLDDRLAMTEQAYRAQEQKSAQHQTELGHIKELIGLIRFDSQRAQADRLEELKRLHERIDVLVERH